MKNKLVFATNNPHKLKEVSDILKEKVDIISLCDNGLHFVEVKSRTAPAEAAPETNVDAAKRRKLASAALAFLNSAARRNLPPDLEVFFDIVTLLFDGPDFELNYYPQAFIPTYA